MGDIKNYVNHFHTVTSRKERLDQWLLVCHMTKNYFHCTVYNVILLPVAWRCADTNQWDWNVDKGTGDDGQTDAVRTTWRHSTSVDPVRKSVSWISGKETFGISQILFCFFCRLARHTVERKQPQSGMFIRQRHVYSTDTFVGYYYQFSISFWFTATAT